jgi:hypothetical protein
MGPQEVALRARSAWRKRREEANWASFSSQAKLGEVTRPVPLFPESQPSAELSAALLSQAKLASEGAWVILHGHSVKVDFPVNWQRDYLTGGVADGARRSRSLNYRAQGESLDPRVVWELSRWTQLVRMAQGAWLAGEEAAGELVLSVLEDWVVKNPVGLGMNWTSPMEPGLRLVNFTWIHRLLGEFGGTRARLDALAEQIVPAHVWWVNRYLSYGSSANNHLLGELAGLILAQARWPQCSHWSAPLAKLGAVLEKEIGLQFHADGGNKEVSLHYHLFAFELCWQAVLALEAVGVSVSGNTKNLLGKAGQFFAAMVSPVEPWDYGDSDDAHVTPFYSSEKVAMTEWQAWLLGKPAGESFRYWLGEPPVASFMAKEAGWQVFSKSGYGAIRQDGWMGRLDASPLGFGSIAAHGQLDMLHLSLWFEDQALVIDPGTGSYFGNKAQREHFVSSEAHNGPHFKNRDLYPARHGAFLWGQHHAIPTLTPGSAECQVSPSHRLHRRVSFSDNRCETVDEICAAEEEFAIHWQFAPECSVDASDNGFIVSRLGIRLGVSVKCDAPISLDIDSAACAPCYRKIQVSPRLRVSGRVKGRAVVTTKFQVLN